MRLVTDFLWFTVGILLVLLFAVNAYPHGGGLDTYGYRHNRKAEDHYYGGHLNRQSFVPKMKWV